MNKPLSGVLSFDAVPASPTVTPHQPPMPSNVYAGYERGEILYAADLNLSLMVRPLNSQVMLLDGTNPMTGPLILHGDPGYANEAATKAYVDQKAGSGSGSNASVVVSDTAPASPSPGNMWWDTVSGNLYIRYVDPDSAEWVVANNAAGSVPSGPATGDLSGTYPSPTVAKLQGRPVSATAPTTGYVLAWDGSTWAPAAGGTGGAPSGPAGGDLSTTYPNPTVAKINGTKLGTLTTTSGNLLQLDAAATWQSVAMSGDGTIAAGGAIKITKSNGNTLVASAWTDTTNATNITTGTLSVARFNNGVGAGTSTFLRGDGTWQAPAGGGNVSTTGTPASGNLTAFSGATTITNSNLSGDATTSGTLAVTVTKTNGVAFAASATTDTTNAANISSGTLNAARLPNPSATTLGGIQSITAVGSKWVAAISTSGVPSLTQPAFTDLTGAATYTQLPTAVQQVPIAFTFSGKPAASAIVNVSSAIALTVPANLVGTTVFDSTKTTASAAFVLNRIANGSATQTAIGTITVTSTSNQSCTLPTSSQTSIAAGDTLQIVAPATQDTTLSDLCITILCTRT